MPQFETEFFSSQIFWTLISFAALFFVLSRWVLPRISGIIQERTELIESEIEEAHKQREEATEIKSEYANKLAEVDRETREMFDESERRIIERRRQLMAEWRDEMERTKRQFHEDAEVARQQAIRDIRAQSADLVAAATEQLIHQKVSGEEAKQALNEAIDEMEDQSRNKE